VKYDARMRAALLVLIAMSLEAAAAPPTGYACAPGATNKGVGCTCPAKHREKRDAENIAVCAAAPTATALQQLLALLNKSDLVAATELARKYDFDEKGQQEAAKIFVKWLAPLREPVALQASRGQCSAVNKTLAVVGQWRALFLTMIGTHADKRYKEYKDDVMDAFIDKLDELLEPMTSNLASCIATASKDDGTAQIKAAYDANKEPIKKCFDGLPETKGPLTTKIVVDADGAIADIKFFAIWTDLDVKLINQRLEMVRLDEIGQRETCFRKAIETWKFKPNARGFAATITVAK